MEFKEVRPTPESLDPAVFMQKYKVGYVEATAMARQVASERIFVNDRYQVTMSKPHPTRTHGWPDLIHLSITRLDGQNVHSWSDLQAIKNVLVGPEYEAIEIYPAESRLVDMGANYHLWVFATDMFEVPIGWKERMVASEIHKEKENG